MATVGTVKTKILVTLQDVNQDNYTDAEVWQYINEALQEIGQELANLQARIALKSDATLTLAATEYTLTLPDDFWVMDKIFRSDADGSTFTTNQLYRADPYEPDQWEDETSSDVGTPDRYYQISTTMYVHPRCNGAYKFKLYYFPKQSIAADADSLPWRGMFDEAIRWFAVSKCYLRDELFQPWQLAEASYRKNKEIAVAAVLQGDDFEIGFNEPYSTGGGYDFSAGYYYSKHYT